MQKWNHRCKINDTGGHQIIGRIPRFFGYFVTNTKKNTEKMHEDSSFTQALSDSLYNFLSRNSKYKSRKSGFLWPLLFVYLISAHIAPYYRKPCFYELLKRGILVCFVDNFTSPVGLAILKKYKLWHDTVLYYRISPLFTYNSQLVNQKLVFFKSKYSVKMTDEECLLIFWKRCLVWEYITSSACAYGWGIGRTHIFNCEIFIICRYLIILPMWL